MHRIPLPKRRLHRLAEGCTDPACNHRFRQARVATGPQQTRCDYLLIAEDSDNPSWVVPLELKKGQVNSSQAVGQLQSGAHVAEELLQSDSKMRFHPVLVYGGSLHRAERNALKKRSGWVRFQNRFQPISLSRCGVQLKTILKAWRTGT